MFDTKEGPYHDGYSSRGASPSITQGVVRARSSRASIHYSPPPPVASGSGTHYHDDNDDRDRDHDDGHAEYLRSQVAHSKSGKSSVRQSIPRHLSAKPSRSSIASVVQSGHLPAWCEREDDNVIVQVWLPWTDRLKEIPCRFHVEGYDHKTYSLEVDYQWNKMIHGSAKFRGAGFRRKGGGRGHLIIE